MTLSRRLQEEEPRLWNKVRLVEGGCWEWTAALTFGYARYWADGRLVRAHRYIFEKANGPIPDDLILDHLCRNRACVNPDHLEIVTQRENILRGVGVTARNARKTHCKRGHPLSGDNLYPHPNGRDCRQCRKLADRRYKERKKHQ